MDPVLEDAYEAIWRGDAPGQSEADLRREVATVDRLEAQLATGRVRPGQIIAWARTHASARERLALRREAAQRALASRGRSHPDNIGQATAAARRTLPA